MVLVRQPFCNRKEWANLPENPEGLEQKTGSCIQMQKKAQKTLKKGLPNPLECGTICERQALKQKNDFQSLSEKPLKRTNRR